SKWRRLVFWFHRVTGESWFSLGGCVLVEPIAPHPKIIAAGPGMDSSLAVGRTFLSPAYYHIYVWQPREARATMATSEFWRSLEINFRAQQDSHPMLRADWDYIVG